MRVFVVDNYDSFTHNLVQPLQAMEHEVRVERNDALTPAEILAWNPAAIVLSPGPKRPEQAGCCLSLVRALGELGNAAPRLLGVCLGHQVLGEAFGAEVVRAERPLHGRSTPIRHAGLGVLSGLPSPFPAARYHSLVVAEPLPAVLEATAWSEEGELMAMRHRDLPFEGVQFHPESFLTPHGGKVLETFLEGVSRG